jgi:hypothetical protein
MLFVGQTSMAQDEAYQRYTNYFSVEGSVAASSAGLGLMPTFAVYRNGHKIDAGLSIKVFDIWKDGPGILGTYLSYKYFPGQRKNDFNLYFGYHNLFSTHDKGKRFPQQYDEVADKITMPKNVLLLENMIGIGFDYQMGNNFYMFNDFSVGVVLDWETFYDSETQMEIRSTGMIRLGMGYNIAGRKAK